MFPSPASATRLGQTNIGAKPPRRFADRPIAAVLNVAVKMASTASYDFLRHLAARGCLDDDRARQAAAQMRNFSQAPLRIALRNGLISPQGVDTLISGPPGIDLLDQAVRHGHLAAGDAERLRMLDTLRAVFEATEIVVLAEKVSPQRVMHELAEFLRSVQTPASPQVSTEEAK